jgi:hypothetical protein
MTVSHPIRLQCREVVERITDLLEGALAPEDLVRLEQHLLVCPPCTLFAQQLRETIELAAETRATTPPLAAATATALAAFRQWKVTS